MLPIHAKMFGNARTQAMPTEPLKKRRYHVRFPRGSIHPIGKSWIEDMGAFNGPNNESSHYQTFENVPAGKQVNASGVTMTYNE